MDEVQQYEQYLRERITALRSQKGVSEHRLSLELGKSGSYIRSITSGATMPSMKELFNIMVYFEVSPAEFFSGLQGKDTLRAALGEKLRAGSGGLTVRLFVLLVRPGGKRQDGLPSKSMIYLKIWQSANGQS